MCALICSQIWSSFIPSRISFSFFCFSFELFLSSSSWKCWMTSFCNFEKSFYTICCGSCFHSEASCRTFLTISVMGKIAALLFLRCTNLCFCGVRARALSLSSEKLCAVAEAIDAKINVYDIIAKKLFLCTHKQSKEGLTKSY